MRHDAATAPIFPREEASAFRDAYAPGDGLLPGQADSQANFSGILQSASARAPRSGRSRLDLLHATRLFLGDIAK